MILILCIDEKGGLSFNHRRQSKDTVLRDRILQRTADSRLWMNGYSARQFRQAGDVTVSKHFLTRAAAGEYCFAEIDDFTDVLPEVEGWIIYRWNRHYPADRHFDVDLSAWRLVETNEFAGSSHEQITEEVYRK